MKKNLLNTLRLWWHCLIKLHRPAEWIFSSRNILIYCNDCEYGMARKRRKG